MRAFAALVASLVVGALLVAGCGARSEIPFERAADFEADAGTPIDAGTPPDAAPPDAASCVPVAIPILGGRVRDFSSSHPDFEGPIDDDPGIVEIDLGADGKPVYAGQAGNPTTSGKEGFDQWYRDVPGVNEGKDLSLSFVPTPTGVAVISDAFFPIDGELLGNEGFNHNYHFTVEIHGAFEFGGDERFVLVGDDDIWLFLNGRLIVDLGGVHSASGGEVALAEVAAEAGIEPGGIYALDLFFAERHTSGSTMRFELIGFSLCE